jgi:signal transduction histidine kinase
MLDNLLNNRSITFKFFLLLIAPISIQSALLLLNAQLWTTTCHDLSVEQEKQVVVRNLNGTIGEWQKWSTFVLEHLSGPREFPLAQQKALLNETNDSLALLKEAVKGNRESLASIAEMVKLLREQATTLAAVTQTGHAAARAQATQDLCNGLYTNCKRLSDLQRKKTIELDSAQFNSDNSLWLTKLATSAFGASALLMAVLIARYIPSCTRVRLAALMRTAARLQKNEMMEPVLEGSDEFSDLEKRLCHVSRELQAESDRKRSILTVITQDLRSPLQTVLASVTIMKERGEFRSEAARIELANAADRVTAVQQQVQQMLTAEKVFDASEARRRVLPGMQDGNLPSETSLTATGSMAFRPGLVQKLLFLVLLPMLAQCGLLYFLGNQIWNTDELVNARRRCLQIQVDLNQNLMDESRAVIAEVLYLSTRKDYFRDRTAKIFDSIDSRCSDMEKLAGNAPGWSTEIRSLKTRQSQFKQKVLGLKKSCPIDLALATVSTRKNSVSELTDRVKELLEKDNEKIQKSEDEQAAKTDRFIKLLGWSIAGSYLLALALLAVLYFHISLRLNRLARNADLLGKQQTLEASIKGADELSLLDEALHQASRQFSEISAQRAQLTSLLSEAVLKPLQQAQNHLTNFGRFSSPEGQALNLLAKAQESNRRIMVLTYDLLSRANLDTGKLDLQISPGDACAIAADAMSAVAGLAQRKSIYLVNHCSESQLVCDPNRLTQVLVNFLRFAIRFSPEKSTILLGCQVEPESVKLFVSDQSPGMDEKTVARIFDQDCQAAIRDKTEEFDPGLAICKLIAEAHHGAVGIESATGKGSTFWITIPTTFTDLA